MSEARHTSRPALGRSLLLQSGGFALGLAVHMLLSRWLGSEPYGDLSVTLSVALLVATLALLGFDRSASQTVSAYAAEGKGALASRFVRYAVSTVAVSALTLAALTWLTTRMAESVFAVDRHPIRDAAALVVPMAVAMLLGSLLAGLRRPLASQILGQVSGRVVLLTLAAWALFGSVVGSEHLAVGLVAVGWIVPAILLGAFVVRSWPSGWTADPPSAGQEKDQRGTWLRTARSYLVATLPLVALEECGILLLELLHSDEAAVGIYAAAHRTAGLPVIALAAARQLAVPELAASVKLGPKDLEACLRPYLRFVFALGALVWLAFVIFGDPLLSLFGHATEQGHLILVLLGAAYVVFLWAGLAAPLLQIHGEHRLVIGTMTALLVLSVAAGVAVIPRWGGEGLAAAFFLLNLCVLGHMCLQVRRRTGVRYFGLLLPDRSSS